MNSSYFMVALFALMALTMLPSENGVAAIDCKDCSVKLCDNPCKDGVNTACQACHSKDVPRECPGCKGRKRREALVAAELPMNIWQCTRRNE